jgi:4-amino-4-deoxy-L-arabinose transferase-like glycosyltransferase
MGLILARMALGANMKGQATLAVAPWALAVLVSARARRSSWTYSQQLMIHVVLAAVVILIWIAIFTQPREEFVLEPIVPSAQRTVPHAFLD